MKLALATAITLALATTAFAADTAKKDTKAPVVAAKAMTETDMDKVTAGSVDPTTGTGIATANSVYAYPSASSQGITNGIGTGNRP